MKLTKRIATICTAATATVLLSAGGAQANDGGGLLSLLDNTPLVQVTYPLKQALQGNYLTSGSSAVKKSTKSGTTDGGNITNNNNNNNNAAGPNNNNNNNNNGGGTSNNNNNNNNVGTQAAGGGLLSILNNSPLVKLQVCYPGQPGQGQSSAGNQNINCNQG